jgi:hypothetical protein
MKESLEYKRLMTEWISNGGIFNENLITQQQGCLLRDGEAKLLF